MTKESRTIDMTPTWSEMTGMLVMLIERGDSTGRASAIAELQHMATLADIASIVLGAHRRPDAPAIAEADVIVAKLAELERLKAGPRPVGLYENIGSIPMESSK